MTRQSAKRQAGLALWEALVILLALVPISTESFERYRGPISSFRYPMDSVSPATTVLLLENIAVNDRAVKKLILNLEGSKLKPKTGRIAISGGKTSSC